MTRDEAMETAVQKWRSLSMTERCARVSELRELGNPVDVVLIELVDAALRGADR